MLYRNLYYVQYQNYMNYFKSHSYYNITLSSWIIIKDLYYTKKQQQTIE